MINPSYAETLFNHLYGHVKGYAISTAARAASPEIDTESTLYGELPFETWQEIVGFVQPNLDGVFFDLGSGTGRIVMASHLLYNFRKSIGVEFLKGLHDAACEVKEDFEINVKPQVLEHVANREIEFRLGDIFKTDLSEADFIFMNHPFKESETFMQLEEKFLTELKSGSKIVTTIRALRDPRFKKLGSQTFKFSWGNSTAHFFEV